jgi:predicted nucleic acid-binding protein
VIIVDAKVLIAHLDSTDANNSRAMMLLESAGGTRIGTSTVTLAEVLVRPTQVGLLREVEAKLRELRLAEVGLGRHAAVRLALLRAETGLKMPDCCVLLAAEDGDATGILTMDERLRAQAVRLGFECPGVQP